MRNRKSAEALACVHSPLHSFPPWDWMQDVSVMRDGRGNRILHVLYPLVHYTMKRSALEERKSISLGTQMYHTEKAIIPRRICPGDFFHGAEEKLSGIPSGCTFHRLPVTLWLDYLL